MKIPKLTSSCACILLLLFSFTGESQSFYTLDVFPSEQKVMKDPHSGAVLRFITTDKSPDYNVYFIQQSWTADSSVLLFYSNRGNGGAMGCILATGELFRLTDSDGQGVSSMTAARFRNSVFCYGNGKLYELGLEINLSENPQEKPSTVYCHERIICELPEVTNIIPLSESCDGKYLSVGGSIASLGGPGIMIVDVSTGKKQIVYKVPAWMHFSSHVQWSWNNPSLLSFAAGSKDENRLVNRIWLLDIRGGSPWCPYQQLKGELVTHESWWVCNAHNDDQMLFCGGLHPRPTEDSHIKILNIRTGDIRIIGPGSWWPDAVPAKISKENWWHASGSKNGLWVAGDNWHGDIMLFDAKTTRPYLLTSGHRTYGGGAHPHVGWDRQSRQVVFTSNKFGNPDVCIATIPDLWQQQVRKEQKELRLP